MWICGCGGLPLESPQSHILRSVTKVNEVPPPPPTPLIQTRENAPPQLMVWMITAESTQMTSPPLQNFRSTPEGLCLWYSLTGRFEATPTEQFWTHTDFRLSISPHLPESKVTPPILLPTTSRNNHLRWVWQFSCKSFCFGFHFSEFCPMWISSCVTGETSLSLCNWREVSTVWTSPSQF